MDAPEDDQDVKLQRASHELLADLRVSLDPFLWKTTPAGRRKIRRSVRVRETDRLVALLEPFQENPQLLDPHLQTLVPVLADAFLACLTTKVSSRTQEHSDLLMTTSRATCRLLYTFCKVRGDKVTVRFLSTEAKHLEMLLSAIETQSGDAGEGSEGSESWDWEERYIALLWLSQLLYAPFDLASISSQSGSDEPYVRSEAIEVPGLVWPSEVPSIAMRTIPLAIHYLSTSSKERDAAKVLLVRVAMRRDMQELGVMDALVKWAISRLRPTSDVDKSTYYYVGVLSFVAGILKSSIGTADMKVYLSVIFDVMQRVCSAEDQFSKNINASPVIRRTSVKILRNISVLLLRSSGIFSSSEMLEWTIGYLLDSLGDSATPVRIASSKALSVITSKLASEMAEQVIEEILNALRKDIIGVRKGLQIPDFSTVNPLEWHGLILTLSQLLYRRAPPPSQLGQIIAALIDGLDFEQRSTSGSSIGTNVRDAANLGIWSIARRYTTVELQVIDILISPSVSKDDPLQKLATILVVSASLDPAGNIRRGSSAALQELIGRHPDTVFEGIQLVQTVEYSSVALRSKAMQEVAVQAAMLNEVYAKTLLTAIESWRGVGDPDVCARRNAAETFGKIACDYMARDLTKVGDEQFWATYCGRINSIVQRLNALQQRQVEERHGLVLCLAAIVTSVENLFRGERDTGKSGFPTTYNANVLSDVRKLLRYVLEDANTSTYRCPELIAEAVCQLLIAVSPLLDLRFSTRSNTTSLSSTDGTIDTDMRIASADTGRLFDLADDLLGKWLRRSEPEVIEAASKASSSIFHLCTRSKQEAMVSNWIEIISEHQGSRTGQDIGVLSTLFRVFDSMPSSRGPIMQATRNRWNLGHDTESRVAILQCLTSTCAFLSDPDQFSDMVAEGLDDYTTDARGDIGSLVRVEALKAVATVWNLIASLGDNGRLMFEKLFPKVLRLAAEKLDKVRSEAQNCVAAALSSESQLTQQFRHYSPSSKEYFYFLLNMPTLSEFSGEHKYQMIWYESLLEGFISSADTGSEDLVRVSRAALAEYCERDSQNLSTICSCLYSILKRNLKHDRILVPAMEVIGFLFDYQIMQRSETNWRNLYALIQNAHYQTGNMRKLEAAVKLYGGLIDVYPDAVQKLLSLLLHKYPRVRNEAADMLFVTKGVGKSVNWAMATQADLIKLKAEIEAARND